MSISADKTVSLDKDFFGEKTVIIAKSGYGKSYTARVIIEEGVSSGNTFIVIDPQDAYLNLESFSYINAEEIKSAKGLAILLSQTNKNTIIRTKKLSIEEQNQFMRSFITEFRKNIRKGIQTIVIDEIHKFAPESQNTSAKEEIRGMFQENRSDGLGCIAITQRISRLDKTILSQADNLCIGKVTSYRDKEAVKNYIDRPEDIEKISKLDKGEFYLYGFGLDEPAAKKIRVANSAHSGGSPQNLLTEDTVTYNNYVEKFVKKRGIDKMADKIETKGEPIKKVIPSMDGFIDLSKMGAKMSLGAAVGGLTGTLLGSRFRSPIPVLSSRTLGSGISTIALYAGYRSLPASFKDMFKYASAGSAVYTAGSLTFDGLAALGIRLPRIADFALSAATGVANETPASTVSGEDVDVDTQFA